jgi:D-alanyl-D-alanine carboxypeptidase (penicillin-binding protein 5/6)
MPLLLSSKRLHFLPLEIVPMTKVLSLLSVALVLFAAATAQAVELPPTLAKEAYVMDYDTGTTLYEKKADERMPTSSMSKVLTMIVVFDAIKAGKLSMDQTLPVSEKAWRMQGSKMWVDINSQIKVEDLVQGVIVQSGNDACIVLAEGIAGSEENFAAMMNAKAKEIGMTNSNFRNASGWPDPDHYSTPRDLALMAKYLLETDGEFYKYYSQKQFTYNNITQGNRNPLLYANLGADGIKTGHTEDAGYGLIGSATRNGRRVIMVINGTKSMQERADEAKKLIEWSLVSFKNINAVKKDTTYAEAPVILGQAKSVPLTVTEDVKMTLPFRDTSAIKMTASYPAPLKAPVKAGDVVGKLTIQVGTLTPQEVPLIAGADVVEAPFFKAALEKLMIHAVGTPTYQ